MVLARFLRGLARLLSDLARNLLAALERLLARVPRLVFDLIGDRTDALVFDLRRRQQHPSEEAGGDSADREANWILLCNADGLLRALADLLAIRRRVADPRRGTRHLIAEALGLVADRLLHPRLDVGLVCQRVDGIA